MISILIIFGDDLLPLTRLRRLKLLSHTECWCSWRPGDDYHIHGSVVLVPLGHPPCRHPRQRLHSLVACALYRERTPVVNILEWLKRNLGLFIKNVHKDSTIDINTWNRFSSIRHQTSKSDLMECLESAGICSKYWCQNGWWCCLCAHTWWKEVTSFSKNIPGLFTTGVLVSDGGQACFLCPKKTSRLEI